MCENCIISTSNPWHPGGLVTHMVDQEIKSVSGMLAVHLIWERNKIPMVLMH